MSLEHLIEPEIPEGFELIENGFIYQENEFRLGIREREVLQVLVNDGFINKQYYNQQYGLPSNSRSLDITITKLRKRLEDVPLKISTIPRYGYVTGTYKKTEFTVTDYGFLYDGQFYSLGEVESDILKKLINHSEVPPNNNTRVLICLLRKALKKAKVPIQIKIKKQKTYTIP